MNSNMPWWTAQEVPGRLDRTMERMDILMVVWESDEKPTGRSMASFARSPIRENGG
ncbi:MAG: hypothetical protein IT427_14815 [Pirellulales bacterium]|nr:hypothetical protein [Pirellulales bacterium]